MASAYRMTLMEGLDIYRALELKQRLTSAILENDEIELDLTQVDQIDTTGLQLLIFARREASRAHKRLSIVAQSAPVQEAIDFCNLGGLLGTTTAAGEPS